MERELGPAWAYVMGRSNVLATDATGNSNELPTVAE
jgi:hypothetical protein